MPATPAGIKYLHKADEQGSATKKVRSTNISAGRPNIVPTGQHSWPVAIKRDRWPHAMAVEIKRREENLNRRNRGIAIVSHYQAQAQARSLLQNMPCLPKPWRHGTTHFDSLQLLSPLEATKSMSSQQHPIEGLHNDIYKCNLHFHFIAYDHGSVNCSLAFDIFHTENLVGEFDYVHTESVWLPH
ncbi:hypothetical protein HYC85_014606 [Camellia sinensis]|uniref:Uncharacterized protein n=1 Tax=Camellia sinensis TaxID=4442 RepID=A0A7J7H6Z6_CAMSI|nr:hypothetical protein HYC85_014606 [Camellia sinensis]